jgi:putative oxidoreductase
MSRSYLWPIGRVLLALIFVISGIFKLTAWGQTAGYMASKGLPLVPVLLVLTIAIEIIGGILVMVGYQTSWSALLIFLYMVPVTLVFHNFWAFQGMEAQMQLVNFLKNLSIMGGLLTVAAASPSPISVDERRSHRHPVERATA